MKTNNKDQEKHLTIPRFIYCLLHPHFKTDEVLNPAFQPHFSLLPKINFLDKLYSNREFILQANGFLLVIVSHAPEFGLYT